MEKLFGKTLAELQQITNEIGLPRYTASQIAIIEEPFPEEMEIDVTDIPVRLVSDEKARQQLSQNFEVGWSAPVRVQQSIDGTKKYLFLPVPISLLKRQ